MQAFTTLVVSIINIYLMIIIIRIWLQLARADFYNPFSQFVVKATQPVVGPLRRLIPSIGKLDTASVVFAIAVSIIKVLVHQAMLTGGLPPIIPLIIVSLTSLVTSVLWMIFWIMVIRAILSWVSQGNNPMELVIAQLTEPLLAPIRRIIPPMGGLDLSVLVFLLLLQFVINLLSGIFGPTI